MDETRIHLKTPRALLRENDRLVEQIRAAMRDAAETKPRMQVLDEDKGVWLDLRGKPDGFLHLIANNMATSHDGDVDGDGGHHAPVPSSLLNRKQRRAAAKKARKAK